MKSYQRSISRAGLSLLELLAAVVILGVLASIIVPRLQSGGKDCKREACKVNRHTIEIQSQLWKRQQGALPASGLSDIAASKAHFPDGIPVCPVDGSAYGIDAQGKVVGHSH
jgi:prepilin-type N-terminal cleavage/methylation domain-containing protein